MPNARMVERLGFPAAALQHVATAQASQTVHSTLVATKATSNIIDSWNLAESRIIALAHFVPLGSAATGAATVAIFHGTATGSMSAASVGTGTTPMQMTGSIGSAGGILPMELRGADLVGKNRYLQAIVTPGTNLAAAVAVDMITEPRYLPPTAANVSLLATPVIVADLT